MPQPTQQTRSSLALRFAAGAGMGGLIVAVPLAAGSPASLSASQILLSLLVVLGSGWMSCAWGDRFLDAISRALNATSV